jgi:hypothetical protein
VIALRKEKKNHAFYFSAIQILKDKIEKKILKIINGPKAKKAYPAIG